MRACGEEDDLCFVEVGEDLAATDAEEEYVAACTDKLEECGPNDDNQSFSNDWCTPGDFPWALLKDEIYDEMVGCFADEACADIGECLEGAVFGYARTNVDAGCFPG